MSWRMRFFGRNARVGFGHFTKQFVKLFQAGGRDDNGLWKSVAMLFDNAEEPPARIFFQCQEKVFPLNGYFPA